MQRRSIERIESWLRDDPVVLRREHRAHTWTLTRAARAGILVRILPGTYVSPDTVEDFAMRAYAVSRWDPRAAICGEAAAHVAALDVQRRRNRSSGIGGNSRQRGNLSRSAISAVPKVIDVATQRRSRPPNWMRASRRHIPTALRRDFGGISACSIALAALDILPTAEAYVHELFRMGLTSKSAMQQALLGTFGRPGNAERRTRLRHNDGQPWSPLELIGHRVFRRFRITGWTPNLRQVVGGQTVYIDVAFPHERVAIEFDGRSHHGDVDAFSADHHRQNLLTQAGWLTLRYTWKQVTSDAAYSARQIRRVLGERSIRR